MTHKERLLATIRGEWLDKPCYTAWGPAHSREEPNAKDLANALINFQKIHDFDFIKHNPSGMYFTEAFGQVIAPVTDMNFQAWMGVEKFVVNDPHQWAQLTPKKILGNSLEREVEVVKRINDYFQGDVPVIATVFSPFIWMGEMTGGFFREEQIVDHFRYSEKYARKGLEVVEETNARLMEAFVDAGAAGFFYGVQNCMAEKMGREMFDEYEKAPSVRLLNLVRDKTWFNMCHMCNGRREYADWFLDYPVDAFNWSDTHSLTQRSMKEMREVTDKVLVGGIDHNCEGQDYRAAGFCRDDFSGIDREETKKLIRRRVDTAIESAGNKLVIAGGCGFNFNAHHRFGVWHEVMEEIAEERAANRKTKEEEK